MTLQEPKQPNAPATPAMTRDCLDPWTYLEISAGGNLRPCCHIDRLTDLDTNAPLTSDRSGAPSVRDNEAFRALREALLSGNLHPRCQRCHIRKTVPVDVLRQRVTAAAARVQAADPLKAMPLTEVRIDINEKCNLRCDYCAVSAPDYRGVEMQDVTFERIKPLLAEIVPTAAVYVNGHGETTYHPDWMKICRFIIDLGVRPLITTNLAKNYSDEEVELLSRFRRVEISLDSDDNELMRTIRKAVRVEHIFETIQRIRDMAARRGRASPDFGFSIGIYDPSVWTLESFVDRIVRIGVTNVTFWDLVEKKHQSLVKALHRLDADEQLRARDILTKVRRRLDLAGVQYQFAGDFHAMVPEPTAADRARMVVGRAYLAASRYLQRAPVQAASRRP